MKPWTDIDEARWQEIRGRRILADLLTLLDRAESLCRVLGGSQNRLPEEEALRDLAAKLRERYGDPS